MSEIVKVLKVEGMSCSHCEKAVKNALSELSGVSNATVDLEGKTATVTFDDNNVSQAELVAAIEDAGYDVLQEN